MPVGNVGGATVSGHHTTLVEESQDLNNGQNQADGTQRIHKQANGYYSPTTPNRLTKRIGPLTESASPQTPLASFAYQPRSDSDRSKARSVSTGPKTARDLSEKIDLMPPLTIEQGTKRLILAKKLDRENLDKYMQASAANSLSQTSSASLTVHIKCQLKEERANESEATLLPQPKESTLGPSPIRTSSSFANLAASQQIATKLNSAKSTTKDSDRNSILIPIHLIITDENDNWPTFSGLPYIVDLNETAPIGSLLQNNEILAFDKDQQGPLSTIEYSILQGSFWSDSFGFLNPLDSRSLIVKDNRLLDYESQSKLTLKVMARDQGDPPNWAITSLYISLIDQDDMNPIFNEDKYSGFIRENRPGEKIDLLPRRMLAHDGDRILSAPITYSFYMKTNHSIHFDLDADLGQLTLKKTLPESDLLSAKFPFCLLVKATQVDNPQRWTLASINIKFAKISSDTRSPAATSLDQTPHFSQPNYTIEVSEAAQIGSTIFTAKTGHKVGTSYQLLDNEQGYLNIDQTSGRLTLNRSLDYEMFRQISVRILATIDLDDIEDIRTGDFSSAYPRLACDIARVNINVINFNDYTPEFSHDQYNFQLSISDLIANFEPTSLMEMEDEPLDLQNRDSNKINRRFGDIELDDIMEDFNHKAIQLGQVYCADRDYGDKLSLYLSGSKANLFYLTQDGRLYLPLVNVSKQLTLHSHNVLQDASKWSAKPNRPINNMLTLSRVFSSTRRSDDQRNSLHDRSYLNYLLSELSNLGRLRLKVHATDGGQPQPKQSTALIVVSILSIDNFIIQRASTASDNVPELIQLTNDTSYQTFRDKSENDVATSADKNYSSSQFMMIPSMNGKSFIHINPDIIGNLLSSSSYGRNHQIHSGDYIDRSKSQVPDTLEPSASNSMDNSLRSNLSGLHQPPGLLLVDEEGAKFVAMPTAMEVFHQQVQEAAGQQARKKLRHNTDKQGYGSFSWSSLGDRLGLNSDKDGLMHWFNVSTAVVLHLIVIVIIISLATRVRSLVLHHGRGNSPLRSNPLDFTNDQRWHRRFSNLNSFSVNKSGDSLTDIESNQHLQAVSSSNQLPAYSKQQANSSNISTSSNSPTGRVDNGTSYSQQAVLVSSGAIVKVRSNSHHTMKPQTLCNNNTELSPEVRNHRENLFDHLKLTLNKMLDNTNDQNASNHVSVRPLDSDVVGFEDQRDRQLDICAQYRETAELKLHHNKKSGEDKATVSTFVGVNQPIAANKSQHPKSHTSENLSPSKQAFKVVSINVFAPKQNIQPSPCGASTKHTKVNSLGSNSSIVSMVSMSSSLSNKITEAVERERFNESGGSSLNSSIILQACSSSGSSQKESASKNHHHQAKKTRSGASKTPPAPPPLPPPPSLVQMRVLDATRNSRFQSISRNKSISNGIDYESRLSTRMSSMASSNSRQAPPENPIHVRLRRDAYADQFITHGRRVQQTNIFVDQKVDQSMSMQKANSRSNSSVGGRPETRQVNMRTSPPTPPPMPVTQQPRTSIGGRKQYSNSTNKTVSPTTSVDRGYESIQSCSSHLTGKQFSSLQECSQYCCQQNCEHSAASSSLPVGGNDINLTRTKCNRKLVGDEAVNYISSKKTLNMSRLPHDRIQIMDDRRPSCVDGDTEDEDFHYFCNEAVLSDGHQLGLSYSKHTFRPGSTKKVNPNSRLWSHSGRRQVQKKAIDNIVTNHQSNEDLIYPYDQQRVTGQACDIMLEPCRFKALGRISSQMANNQQTKKLTWSDQLHIEG